MPGYFDADGDDDGGVDLGSIDYKCRWAPEAERDECKRLVCPVPKCGGTFRSKKDYVKHWRGVHWKMGVSGRAAGNTDKE